MTTKITTTTPIDLLPKYFRGVVAIGLPNGEVYIGLKGSYDDKDAFKAAVPGIKWQPVPSTKSWLVKMTNANQKEVLSRLKQAVQELNLTDAATEGLSSKMANHFDKIFKYIGIGN